MPNSTVKKFTRILAVICTVMCMLFVANTYAQVQPNLQASQSTSANQQNGNGFAPISGLPAMKVTTQPDGSQEYSITLQILFLMTALTFLPAILIMMTAFTRIIIVFSILRQALGLQQSPSNQILIGLTLFHGVFTWLSATIKSGNLYS